MFCLQRDDEGLTVEKDPTEMDRRLKRWKKEYDKKKREEERQAIMKGEHFEGIEGERTEEKDVLDESSSESDTFYDEMNSSCESVLTDDISTESATDSSDTTSTETDTDEDDADEDNSNETDEDDIQPVPRTRQANFTESDDTSDYSGWEGHAKRDSDETPDSELSDKEVERRRVKREKDEKTFQRKTAKQHKGNEKKRAAGEPTIPTSIDELDEEQRKYTRDGIKQWKVDKPEDATDSDVEELKKIDDIQQNKIGHHPADSMLAGRHARLITTPPPDTENNPEEDPRIEVIELQNDTIRSLQGTVAILVTRQRWYDKRLKREFINKDIDKKTMRDRSRRIRENYAEKQQSQNAEATATSASSSTTTTATSASSSTTTATSASSTAVTRMTPTGTTNTTPTTSISTAPATSTATAGNVTLSALKTAFASALNLQQQQQQPQHRQQQGVPPRYRSAPPPPTIARG